MLTWPKKNTTHRRISLFEGRHTSMLMTSGESASIHWVDAINQDRPLPISHERSWYRKHVCSNTFTVNTRIHPKPLGRTKDCEAEGQEFEPIRERLTFPLINDTWNTTFSDSSSHVNHVRKHSDHCAITRQEDTCTCMHISDALADPGERTRRAPPNGRGHMIFLCPKR